ncbi:MAG: RagB/SusD family nutrient uptake outer membrane protein [Prevotella sp.]|nr:RagB/SusD family nutrient uptake outer membrane protein [Prevotella sp.]
MKLKYLFIAATLALPVFTACEDLDTAPEGATLTEEQKGEVGEAKPERAEAGVRGIFSQFNVYMPNYDAIGSRHNDFGYSSIMMFTDANTEDVVSDDNGYNWAGNSLTFDDRVYTSRESQIVWNDYYKIIFSANTVISSLDAESEDALTQYYLGQGLAARAFSYLELAQLYQFNYKGNETKPCVPLITDENSSEAATNGAPRATVEDVYAQVEKDLTLAIELLDKAAAAGQKRSDRRYIDVAVAYGLRARMNLAKQNWSAAAADAQAAIDKTDARPATIDEVSAPTFCNANEPNWMWAIYIAETDDVVQSGIVNWISHCGTFNYGYGQYSGGHQISKKLYNSIADTDIRKGWWSDADGVSQNLSDEWNAYLADEGFAPYTNCKFAPYQNILNNDVNANDIPLMRVEEMYLILAEAQQMAGQNGKATLENFVRTYRDPAYSCTASDVQNEIYRQKRIELWGEGRIWFDVMRLGKGVDRRGAGFGSTSVFNIASNDPILLWRLPQTEINGNSALTDADNNTATAVPTAIKDEDVAL